MSGLHSSWVGRSWTAEDFLTPGVIEAFCAVFDWNEDGSAGSPIPLGGHWLLAPPRAPSAALGVDGHPRRGSQLPPIDAKRRMWAGSRMQFLRPLIVGELCRRTSVIVDVNCKEAPHGPLWLVEVEHVIETCGEPAVHEVQTIAYTDAPPGAAPSRRPGFEPQATSIKVPDEVLLFRYSALTFNSHRIHYDLPYASQQEGYPGLVVHGPLTATFLLHFCRSMFGGRPIRAFSFRGVRPAFAGEPMQLVGRESAEGVELAALNSNGECVMMANAELDAKS